MTITVLLAPDGSVAHALAGRWGKACLLESAPYPIRKQASAHPPEDGFTHALLNPGYRLEHHDLAELLARPTAEELQAAKDADHASTQEAFKLGAAIWSAKVARLEAEIETHKVAIKNLRGDLLHCECGQ